MKTDRGEDESEAALPGYLRGVRFACTQCGACCTGAPGRVRVSEEEIRRIAVYRGEEMGAGEMPDWVVADGEGGLRLREEADGDCVFYRDGGCAIHAVKPGQCRRYPFWFRNVRSAEAWARTCAACPGIGEGAVVDPAVILRTVAEDLEALRPGTGRG